MLTSKDFFEKRKQIESRMDQKVIEEVLKECQTSLGKNDLHVQILIKQDPYFISQVDINRNLICINEKLNDFGWILQENIDANMNYERYGSKLWSGILKETDIIRDIFASDSTASDKTEIIPIKKEGFIKRFINWFRAIFNF